MGRKRSRKQRDREHVSEPIEEILPGATEWAWDEIAGDLFTEVSAEELKKHTQHFDASLVLEEDEAGEEAEVGAGEVAEKESQAAAAAVIEEDETGEPKQKKQKTKKQLKRQKMLQERREFKKQRRRERLERERQQKLDKKLERQQQLAWFDWDANADMAPWRKMDLPPQIMHGLLRRGFSSPTRVQTAVIESAIHGKSILAAAPTGSGKTLAFGLPVLTRILQRRAKEEEKQSNFTGPLPQQKSQAVGMSALIVVPTRELALQVRKELLETLCKSDDQGNRHNDTGIDVVTVVGGMSLEKQLRLLSKQPQVVVATPGRLWALMRPDSTLVSAHDNLETTQVDIKTLGVQFVRNMGRLNFLVFDEADRLVADGHFRELSSILDYVHAQKGGKPLQSMLFSATLSMDARERLETRKTGEKKSKMHKRKQQKQGSVVAQLVEELRLQSKSTLVVDLSEERKVAQRISERFVRCVGNEKEQYLCALLMLRQCRLEGDNVPDAMRGLMVVFVNAVTYVRRLSSLLRLLDLPVFTLHAHMHQKRRLKALDQWKKSGSGILLSTDVAARGVDVPEVNLVVHAQLPRSAEIYVHRSGRTARAGRSGASLALVAPEELPLLSAICQSINRKPTDVLEEGERMLQFDPRVWRRARARYRAAVQLDKMQLESARSGRDASWVDRMAHDAGLELEGDLARQVQQRQAEKRQHEKRIKGATGNLKHLLSQPLLPRQVPTSFDAMLFGEGDDVLTAFNNASNNSKNSDSSVSQQETQETPLQEDDNANEQQDSEDESDSESDVYVSDY